MKKYQAGGTTNAKEKAPAKKGDFITVKKRNLPPAKAKKGACVGCGNKKK